MPRINVVRSQRDTGKQPTIWATALRCEMTGRWHQALDLYRHNTLAARYDWITIKRIADLLVRMNRFEEAAQAFARLAEISTAEGSFRTAVAAWKQAARLAPVARNPCLSIGDLYVAQGFKAEAKRHYGAAYDEVTKRGELREAVEVLEKLADCDSHDLKVRIALAGANASLGNREEAAEQYIAIAHVLVGRGKLLEANQVLKQALRSDPVSGRLRLELARVQATLGEQVPASRGDEPDEE